MEIIKHNLQFNQMTKRDLKKIVLIILHHQCGKGQTVEEIHNYHKNKLKWAGIGYHFFIDFEGNVHQGRPIEYVGSHCAGNNTSSIGICFEGDFRKDKPTEAQLKSCKELIKELNKKLKKDLRVLNHNDLYATLCPVINLKEMVK
jgi:hypothetical protein